MPETVVITGGAGFIGSHLAEGFLRNGYTVRVLDNFSTGREYNLSAIRKEIELLQVDIRDLKPLTEAFRGADVILHHAGIVSVPLSLEDPLSTHAVNVTGTLNVLLAAGRAGVRRVINASSSAVYGDTQAAIISEAIPTQPVSPYGLSKLESELHMTHAARTSKLETLSFRYFNVFGPRQSPDSGYAAVIPLFIKKLASGNAPVIFGDGMQSRDFTFIDDIVEANLRAARAPLPSGGILNIATGERTTLNGLVQMLNEIFGSQIKPQYTGPRPGDIEHSCADITASKTILGNYNSVPLREGLVRTSRWYLESTGRVQRCE